MFVLSGPATKSKGMEAALTQRKPRYHSADHLNIRFEKRQDLLASENHCTVLQKENVAQQAQVQRNVMNEVS